jgi:glycosyltransferase involved in cell wall biosynthesis
MSTLETEEIGAALARRAGTRAKGPVRVLHTLSGLHVGGVGRMLLRNVVALESDRVRNYVAYLIPNHMLEAQYRAAGFDPVCLDHRHTAHGPRTLQRLVMLIRELDVDVVHTNHTLDRLYAGLAAKLAAVPTITTAHDTLRGPSTTGERLRSWLDRQLLSQYIAVSAAVAHRYQTSRGIPPSRIRVIHSGIELEKFARPPSSDTVQRLKEELGLHDAHPVLLNVGRLHSIKGQKYLVPMMAHVLRRWPHAKLLLVGRGGERAGLEKAIAEAGLENSIRLLGLRDDIRELLAISTFFVFPSLGEGLPISVLEAMAAGKPVIASSVGPMPEMIEDGVSGLLVPPTNPVALADAVDRLMSSPELSLRMGQRGQELAAERFSIRSAVQSMENLYRAVLP